MNREVGLIESHNPIMQQMRVGLTEGIRREMERRARAAALPETSLLAPPVPGGSAAAADVIEIRFQMSQEDHLAFHDHFHRSSSIGRRGMWRSLAAVSLIVLFFITITFNAGLSRGRTVYDALLATWPFIVMWLLFVVFYRRYRSWTVRRHVVRLLNEGENRGAFSQQMIRFDSSGIRDESEFGSHLIRWGLVERVVVASTHVFVYLSGSSALILPTRAFHNDRERMLALQLIASRTGVPVTCPACSYDLRGTQDARCPECGFPEEGPAAA